MCTRMVVMAAALPPGELFSTISSTKASPAIAETSPPQALANLPQNGRRAARVRLLPLGVLRTRFRRRQRPLDCSPPDPSTVGLMSSKTAIQYQGEANVGKAAYYSCIFPAMIAD